MSQASDSGITVWDEYGYSYALNTIAQEVRYADGRVIELTPDLTADFATNFQGTLDYDRLVNSIDSSDSELDCHPQGPGCIDPYATINNGVPNNGARLQMRKVSSTFDGIHAGNQFGTKVIGVGRNIRGRSTFPHGAPSSGVLDFSELALGETCAQMKQDIVMQAANFKTARSTTYGAYRAFAWDLFVYIVDKYVFKMGTLPVLVGTTEANIAAQSTEQTKLNIARSIYTASGCGTISWNNSGGSLSGLNVSCSFEVWEVTQDNWVTFQYFTIYTCVYTK